MNWDKVEKAIGETLPACIKKILSACAYETLVSLNGISLKSVESIEEHINNSCQTTIQDLDCCYSDYYKNQEKFKLLPGHRDLLLALSKLNLCDSSEYQQKSKFSFIMQEMINTAMDNAKRDDNRYSDFIRFFATYF